MVGHFHTCSGAVQSVSCRGTSQHPAWRWGPAPVPGGDNCPKFSPRPPGWRHGCSIRRSEGQQLQRNEEGHKGRGWEQLPPPRGPGRGLSGPRTQAKLRGSAAASLQHSNRANNTFNNSAAGERIQHGERGREEPEPGGRESRRKQGEPGRAVGRGWPDVSLLHTCGPLSVLIPGSTHRFFFPSSDIWWPLSPASREEPGKSRALPPLQTLGYGREFRQPPSPITGQLSPLESPSSGSP